MSVNGLSLGRASMSYCHLELQSHGGIIVLGSSVFSLGVLRRLVVGRSESAWGRICLGDLYQKLK